MITKNWKRLARNSIGSVLPRVEPKVEAKITQQAKQYLPVAAETPSVDVKADPPDVATDKKEASKKARKNVRWVRVVVLVRWGWLCRVVYIGLLYRVVILVRRDRVVV